MPTLHDVAKACNVSAMTVSHVLNNKAGRVSPATRERVLRTVRELNYHPNAVARGLTGRRLNTLGVVYLHSHEPIHTAESFVMMLDGILDMATRRKQDTLMCTSYSWEDGIRDVSRLLDRRCDGLILVVPTIDNPLFSVLSDTKTPTVLLCAKSNDPEFSFVDTDNVAAARQLVGRALALGHRRVALLHGDSEENYLYCTERMEGFRLALADYGIPFEPEMVVKYAWGEDEASPFLCAPTDVAERLSRLAAGEQPTAIFCVTDVLALQLIPRLQARGVRVPEDISVLGFDDIPRAATATPGLTTVRQPFKEIAWKCVELLLTQIQEGRRGQRVLFPTELIERGSLAPPAVG